MMSRRARRFPARRVACAAIFVAIAVVILGLSAHLRWNTPLWSRDRLSMPAHDFRVVMGAGAEDGDSLRVGAIGNDGNGLQMHALDRLHADDWPILHYRFEGFPRTLELSLVFRRADSPQDVQAISVPWPGDGWHSVDLRGIPEWHGEIVEIGFAEFATGQLVPPSVGFRPFRFDSAELSALSWCGGLATLREAWFSYRPWAFMSISALVPDRGTSGTSSPLLALVAIIVFGVLAIALTMRWSRAHALGYVAVAGASLWLMLDMRWLGDLWARHGLTERVYAGRPWRERERLQPDENVAAAAEQVRNWLGSNAPASRVLIESDSDYVYLRLAYLLLPRNVGLLYHLGGSSPPEGGLVLLYDSTRWAYDAARGELSNGTNAYPVDPVFESADAHLYRVKGTR